MIVTIDSLKSLPDFEILEFNQTELYSLTVKYKNECVFQKSYTCCPHENRENVKQLILAHCEKRLIDLKII